MKAYIEEEEEKNTARRRKTMLIEYIFTAVTLLIGFFLGFLCGRQTDD